MTREEIIMFNPEERRDIEVFVDVYTIREMIKTMNHQNHCLFLIDALGKIYGYSDKKMKKLEHEFLHCFLWDRKVMMIDE